MASRPSCRRARRRRATTAKWLAVGVVAAVRSGAFSLSSNRVDPTGACGGHGLDHQPGRRDSRHDVVRRAVRHDGHRPERVDGGAGDLSALRLPIERPHWRSACSAGRSPHAGSSRTSASMRPVVEADCRKDREKGVLARPAYGPRYRRRSACPAGRGERPSMPRRRSRRSSRARRCTVAAERVIGAMFEPIGSPQGGSVVVPCPPLTENPGEYCASPSSINTMVPQRTCSHCGLRSHPVHREPRCISAGIGRRDARRSHRPASATPSRVEVRSGASNKPARSRERDSFLRRRMHHHARARAVLDRVHHVELKQPRMGRQRIHEKSGRSGQRPVQRSAWQGT